MPAHRRHFKVEALPPEVRADVCARLEAGHTYVAVANYLRSLGHAIATSAIGHFWLAQQEHQERLALGTPPAMCCCAKTCVDSAPLP